MVTGGAGFVGTNLIKRLLKDGHEVVSIDNYSTGTEENHQEVITSAGFEELDRDEMLKIVRVGKDKQRKQPSNNRNRR